MSDYRNSETHRNSLSYGFYKEEGKETYELDRYLPPITDFVYCPDKDSWIRRVQQDYQGITPKNTRLLLNRYKYSAYAESITKVLVRNKYGFMIDKNGHEILEVAPLKEGDDTEYISSIYISGVLDLVLRECVSNRRIYMRLRLVSKRFKQVIDTSDMMVRSIVSFIRIKKIDVSSLCLLNNPITSIKAIIRNLNAFGDCRDNKEYNNLILKLLAERLHHLTNKRQIKERLKRTREFSLYILDILKENLVSIKLKDCFMISNLLLTINELKIRTNVTVCGKEYQPHVGIFFCTGYSRLYRADSKKFSVLRSRIPAGIEEVIDEKRPNSIFWQSKPMNFLRGFSYLE